jgi:hypothetical protein
MITIRMLEPWKKELIRALEDLYQQQIVRGFRGDTDSTEVWCIVDTSESIDDMEDLLREQLNFSGYLSVKVSTTAEVQQYVDAQ